MAQSGDYTYTQSGGNATITAYTGAGGVLTIPATLDTYPVITIANSAFNNAAGHKVTGITIPNSVTLIDSYAFYGCTLMAALTISNSVVTIGTYTFAYCSALTSIIVGSGVNSVGVAAWAYCTALVAAHFHGNAPATWSGTDVFSNVHAGFVIYYYTGATGWTNPYKTYTTASESPPSTSTPSFFAFFWS